MTLAPKRDLTAELADTLHTLVRRYLDCTAVADRSHKHQMAWMATQLKGNLELLGWAPTAPAGETYQAAIEHAVKIPTEVAGNTHHIACSSLKHAIEVANESTTGTNPAWRAVGPWRTDIENDPTNH